MLCHLEIITGNQFNLSMPLHNVCYCTNDDIYVPAFVIFIYLNTSRVLGLQTNLFKYLNYL